MLIGRGWNWVELGGGGWSWMEVGAYNFIKKETSTQMFSCEFCEIFNNTIFYRTPYVATSLSTRL